ncbi:MAG: hypothetical protein M1829_003984 [Trizodia sp. TS-e1964]|nr:MAG: hypothetical protein M1829_003984 [Trizodia sp. TS-e1964]
MDMEAGSSSGLGNDKLEPLQAATNILVVAEKGDLILDIKHRADSEPKCYLVSTARLRNVSAYFRVLLHPSKFKEGAIVQEAHARMREKQNRLSQEVINDLPHISISDIGPVAFTEGRENPMMDLLQVLHGNPIASVTHPTLSQVANLGIVADRFECLPLIVDYAHRENLFRASAIKVKGANRTTRRSIEDRWRQKIVVGWYLNDRDFMWTCSKRLILRGSSRWSGDDSSQDSEHSWLELPFDLEGRFPASLATKCLQETKHFASAEMVYRRECILETISSLQMHLLRLYTTPKHRRCKLGYDSSIACDTFQLGEILRFFTRIGTLKMQSLITGAEASEAYAHDIEFLISELMRCPSYQIDANHSHCGMRVKLTPALEFIQGLLKTDVGICRDCWGDGEEQYSWSKMPRAGDWEFLRGSTAGAPARQTKDEKACKAGHRIAWAVFTASKRNWTP